MYLLATGQTLLNHYLREKALQSEVVDYLEGIELATSLYKPKTVILSEYIYRIKTSRSIDERYQDLFQVIASLRENHIRIILLVSFHAPTWFYQNCVEIGVYDLILTNAMIEEEIIYSFMEEKTTKEQANHILTTLSFACAEQHQMLREPTPHNVETITIDDTFPNGNGIFFSFSQIEKDPSQEKETKESSKHVKFTI